MKKIKLYDFDGDDGKIVEVSMEAILSKGCIVVCDLEKISPGKIKKSNKGLVKKGEKKCEK